MAALAAGAAVTAASASTAAYGGVVRVSDRPLEVVPQFDGTTSTAGWDVDGDGFADEIVFAGSHSAGFYGSGGFGPNPGHVAFFDQSFRYPPFVLTAPVFSVSDVINDTVAAQYSFEAGAIAQATLSGTAVQGAYGILHAAEVSVGHNIIGFVFHQNSDEHYGFAHIVVGEEPLAGGRVGPKLKIRAWAYEDEPGAAIHVEPIPAPPAALSALTMLGLGAAGMRAWRKRKTAA